jgi:ABC-type glycerol-3-phosphate transport system permease component
MAAVTLTTIPSLVLFLAFQRWISRGLAFSGIYQ